MSIVTNGLVLYMDSSNTAKSYKGANTVNYVTYPYANYTGSAFSMPSYNYDATGTHTYSYVTGISNPVNSPGIMRYSSGSTGYKYWAITIPGASLNTGTYTFSYYARIVAAPSTGLNVQEIWRKSGIGDITPTGDWNPTFTSSWKRYTLTGDATNSGLDIFIIHSGSLTGKYVIDFCGFQLESGSYATPFVSGSRSTTQSLLDMTRNTTLTANVTYASDGTFSLNGTGNAIYSLNPVNLPIGSSNRTMICWCKPDTTQVNADAYTGLIAYGARTASGGALLSINTSGSIFYATSAYWNNDYTPSTVVVNKAAWNMVAVTTLGDGVVNNTTLYCGNSSGINSVTGSSSSYATPLNLASSYLTVGATDYFGRWFKGSIGAAMIYNRQLSLAELNQIFYATKARYGL